MTANATSPLAGISLSRAIALRAAADFVLNSCDANDPSKGVRERPGHNNDGEAIDGYAKLFGYATDEDLPWCALAGAARFVLAEQRINAELAKAKDPRRVALPSWFPRSAKQNAAACATYKQLGKEQGLWKPVSQVIAAQWTPRRGDIVIFDWDNRPGNDHFGIVLAYNAQTGILSTCEGNTTPSPGVSRESNKGDGIWQKRRTLGQLGPGGGFVKMDC